MLFIVLSVFIEELAHVQTTGIIICGITLSLLIIILILQSLFKGLTLILTVLIFLIYSIYRLLVIKTEYNTEGEKARLFFAGYLYEVFYTFLIKCLPSTLARILTVIVFYLLRFGIFIFVIDSSAAHPGTLIRGAIIDIFIIYFFHSAERTDRRVFMDFVEKREELLQFKELLADSLPLGVTVVEYNTLKPLFSNAAFLGLFSCQITTDVIQTRNSPINQDFKLGNDQIAMYLSFLFADEASIREFGKGHDLKHYDLNSNFLCLEDVLKDLVKGNLLVDKTLSLTAYEKISINPRSFQAILKHIKWSGIDSIAVILNDITYQEKLMYWKLVNANKDRIITTVSHELKTPLNGIIGLLEMIKKRIEHCEALEYISLCKDNAHLLLNLVNSMLDLHQLEAGKLKLTISTVNLRKCVQEVLKLFQFQVNKKGISLTLSLGENVPVFINTDENRLNQVLISLIGSAIKFTSSEGIEVAVRENPQEPNYLVISVTDTGIKRHEDDMNKLENEESVNKHGVGLDSTISNALVVILSGNKEKEVQVTGKYGKGSSFSFNILKDLKSEASNESISSKESSNKKLPEQQNPLNLNKLLFQNVSEFESYSIQGNLSNVPAETEELGSKLAKYQTFHRENTLGLILSQSSKHETIKEDYESGMVGYLTK